MCDTLIIPKFWYKISWWYYNFNLAVQIYWEPLLQMKEQKKKKRKIKQKRNENRGWLSIENIAIGKGRISAKFRPVSSIKELVRGLSERLSEPETADVRPWGSIYIKNRRTAPQTVGIVLWRKTKARARD